MIHNQQQLRDAKDQVIRENFFYFLLDKWMISSGEHKGDRWSFRDAPYLMDITKDTHSNIVVMKSAQSRISEMFVAKAIWKAVSKRGNLLYTFPAGEQMQQFVDARIREAVLANPYLSKFVTGSLNLKKFSLNHNSLYFRGVQKRRQIISVDVSDATFDEIDEYPEGAIYTLTKRLGAAKNPSIVQFSTPTFHGMGISLAYYGSESSRVKGSDQKVWCIKCEHCGYWNEDLTFERNIIDKNEADLKFSHYEPDAIVVCATCKKPINRLSSKAEWVARFPKLSELCHGYHISKLFAPLTSINQLVLDSRDPAKEQEHHNSDLGLPFEPKGSRLTDAVLNKARGTHQLHVLNKIPSFAGVDIGSKIHAIASVIDTATGKNKVIGVQELDDWEDLSMFVRDFNVKTMVIDMNPEKDEAIAFQDAHPDVKVFLANFNQHLERTAEKFTADKENMLVGIHRTYMMMLVSDYIHDEEIVLPIDIKTVKDFYTQMKSPIKAQKTDNTGNMVVYYPKTNQPDHYYFALLYNVVASLIKTRPSLFKIVQTMM